MLFLTFGFTGSPLHFTTSVCLAPMPDLPSYVPPPHHADDREAAAGSPAAVPAGRTCLYFTTNPGLEDVAAEEFMRRAREAHVPDATADTRPFKLAGHVLARAPAPREALEPLAWKMRSIHHVLRPVHGFPLTAGHELSQIQSCLQNLPVPEMTGAASFRVTTKRIGQHDFTSIDVQRTAGAALVAQYNRPVDLENYALNVRVDVFEQFCLVSIQLTQTSLSKRFARRYRPRAALKTPVAYAMLQFAGLLKGSGAVLDPFCGSGTILIEAAEVNSALQLYGSDLFPEAIQGVRANLDQLGMQDRIDIRQADARALTRHFPAGAFRAIVTNPPYGVTLGQHLDFRRFYYHFLMEAGKVLVDKGMLVMLSWKRGHLVRALRDHGGFNQRHVRVVETGDLYPRIFVLQRKST